jgi:hypothetical protein
LLKHFLRFLFLWSVFLLLTIHRRAVMAFQLFAEMKAHPYTTGAIGLVGVFVLYELMKGGSSGASQTGNQAQAAAQLAAQQQAMSLQEQQLQQAGSLQAQQTNAQLQASYASAQAANNQNIASVQAQYNQTDAALIAALATNQTQQQGQAIQGTVLNNQLSAELAATENNNATNLAAYSGTLGYQTGIAQLQAALTGQSITAQTQLASQQLQNNYNLSNQTLNMVGQAGLNHGTSSLEQQLAAITTAALGQQNVGIAAEQAAASVGAAQAQYNPTNTLISTLGKIGGTVATGLLG